MTRPRRGAAPQAKPSRFWPVLFERAEIAWTVIMDGALLLAVLVVRMVLLMFYRWTTAELEVPAEELAGFAVKLVEGILDVGLLATAIFMTVFDLLKRVVRSWRALSLELRKGVEA